MIIFGLVSIAYGLYLAIHGSYSHGVPIPRSGGIISAVFGLLILGLLRIPEKGFIAHRFAKGPAGPPGLLPMRRLTAPDRDEKYCL